MTADRRTCTHPRGADGRCPDCGAENLLATVPWDEPPSWYPPDWRERLARAVRAHVPRGGWKATPSTEANTLFSRYLVLEVECPTCHRVERVSWPPRRGERGACGHWVIDIVAGEGTLVVDSQCEGER